MYVNIYIYSYIYVYIHIHTYMHFFIIYTPIHLIPTYSSTALRSSNSLPVGALTHIH